MGITSAANLESPAWEQQLHALARQAVRPDVPRTPVPVADALLLERAYAHCETVISEHGKTFNLASSLLPPRKRRAIRALYAFCRVTDNIVDSQDGTPEARETALRAWRYSSVAALPSRQDLVATAWADTRLRFKVPHRYAEQLIDGVGRDLYQHRYRNFEELATYAYRVASTVGLMSMSIIGLEPGCLEEEATPFVIKLGLALQITNILRDVGEDWRAGRVYLPEDELAAFDLGEVDLAHGRVDDRWRAFMRFQIERNRRLYSEAWPCIGMFHSDGRFAVAAACALYRAILGQIEANDYDVFTRRAHVSTAGKLLRLPAIWWRNH
jgi:phytoene synthase